MSEKWMTSMNTYIHHTEATHGDTEPYLHASAGQAIVAGIIGGILIDLFLIVTRTAPFPGIYQFVASSLVGKVAFTSSSYIWLGVAMHFVVSIGWALIYAYSANAAHFLRRWVVGGLIFGIVVMVAMQTIEILLHTGPALSVGIALITLISHIVFFGWPIAWYLSRPRGASGDDRATV